MLSLELHFGWACLPAPDSRVIQDNVHDRGQDSVQDGGQDRVQDGCQDRGPDNVQDKGTLEIAIHFEKYKNCLK